MNVLGGNSLGSIFAIFSLCAEVPSSLFPGSFEKCTVHAVHPSGDEVYYDYSFLLLLPSLSDVSLLYRTAYVQYVPEYAGESAVAKDAC